VKKGLIFLFIIYVLHFPFGAWGTEKGNISGKISWGYDENIFEKESEKNQAFTRIYLDSKLPLVNSKRLYGILRLQDGLKILRNNGNLALNQVNLRLAYKISSKIISEFLTELKYKDIYLKSNSSMPSEYGYLKWHGGLSLKLLRDNFSGKIRYLERRHDYSELDFYDSKIRQIQLMTNIRFSKLNACLMGSWQHLRYPNLVNQEPEVKEAKFESQSDNSASHIDNLYEFSISFQFIHRGIFNPGYTFQKNKSELQDYSFEAHQLSIIAVIPLFWEITMQFYGRLQLRTQEIPSVYLPDEDNTEQARDILILDFNKEICKRLSLETRYLLSRSVLSDSTKYTKKVYSLTVSYLF